MQHILDQISDFYHDLNSKAEDNNTEALIVARLWRDIIYIRNQYKKDYQLSLLVKEKDNGRDQRNKGNDQGIEALDVSSDAGSQ